MLGIFKSQLTCVNSRHLNHKDKHLQNAIDVGNWFFDAFGNYFFIFYVLVGYLNPLRKLNVTEGNLELEFELK